MPVPVAVRRSRSLLLSWVVSYHKGRQPGSDGPSLSPKFPRLLMLLLSDPARFLSPVAAAAHAYSIPTCVPQQAQRLRAPIVASFSGNASQFRLMFAHDTRHSPFVPTFLARHRTFVAFGFDHPNIFGHARLRGVSRGEVCDAHHFRRSRLVLRRCRSVLAFFSSYKRVLRFVPTKVLFLCTPFHPLRVGHTSAPPRH